jgi:glutamate-1-semialdehyde 2,1-aminomutase
MTSAVRIDRERLRLQLRVEQEKFANERPVSRDLTTRGRSHMPNGVPMAWMAATYRHAPLFVDRGSGCYFWDVDGNRYVDFNLADMSTFGGYAPPPVVAAVAEQLQRGIQFMLPTADAPHVSAELAARFGKPYWQFTLSASQAIAETVRLARATTGRARILIFDGKYHGHAAEVMSDLVGGSVIPEQRGVLADAVAAVDIVQFNDIDAVRRVLHREATALVLTEPVMTNNHGLILPEPGFLAALAELSRQCGSLLAFDETHTLVCASGGLTAGWKLGCDIVVLGKSVGGGVACGAYGMSDELADRMTYDVEATSFRSADRIATGGTLFANPLQIVAMRAALEHVLVPEAYEQTSRLGLGLASGLRRVIRREGLEWSVSELYCRSALHYGPPPRNADEARRADDLELRRWQRLFFANRGVWDAIIGAGPTVGIPAVEEDVDLYLSVFSDWISTLAEVM